MALKSSQIEVVSLESRVGYVFAADNPRTRRAFQADVAVALAKELGAADFVVQPGERPHWSVRQGAIRFSPQRRIAVTAVTGSAHELTVIIEGSTEDARDVLADVWTKLGETEADGGTALTDFQGTYGVQTTAIVRLPVVCTELIPPLGAMMAFAKERLGSVVLVPEGALPFQLRIPLSIAVRGATTERALVIEPRFTSLIADRVYFTVSPLASDEHLEMLERVVETVQTRS